MRWLYTVVNSSPIGMSSASAIRFAVPGFTVLPSLSLARLTSPPPLAGRSPITPRSSKAFHRAGFTSSLLLSFLASGEESA